MAESEISRRLCNGSLTSKAIGAAPGGSLSRRYTLQFLIACIKRPKPGDLPLEHERGLREPVSMPTERPFPEGRAS
jgi:hypothetical protein